MSINLNKKFLSKKLVFLSIASFCIVSNACFASSSEPAPTSSTDGVLTTSTDNPVPTSSTDETREGQAPRFHNLSEFTNTVMALTSGGKIDRNKESLEATTARLQELISVIYDIFKDLGNPQMLTDDFKNEDGTPKFVIYFQDPDSGEIVDSITMDYAYMRERFENKIGVYLNAMHRHYAQTHEEWAEMKRPIKKYIPQMNLVSEWLRFSIQNAIEDIKKVATVVSNKEELKKILERFIPYAEYYVRKYEKFAKYHIEDGVTQEHPKLVLTQDDMRYINYWKYVIDSAKAACGMQQDSSEE